MKILACIILIIGLMMRYVIKRRKFSRTTFTGVELFKSYEVAWLTRLIENIIFWIGTLMAFGGVILLIIKW
jgi:hypothetical protein